MQHDSIFLVVHNASVVRGRATFGGRMVGLVRLACERGTVSKPECRSDDHELDTLNFFWCVHCRLMCLDLVLCGDRKEQSERVGSGSWAHPTFAPSPDLRTLPAGSPQASDPKSALSATTMTRTVHGSGYSSVELLQVPEEIFANHQHGPTRTASGCCWSESLSHFFSRTLDV